MTEGPDEAALFDDLTVVVVNYFSGDLLTRCIESVIGTAPGIDVVIVDNSPQDGWADANARRWPTVRCVGRGDNVGFAGGANYGAARSGRTFLLFLNPDAIVTDGAIGLLRSFLRGQPHVGVCGPAVSQESSGVVELGATIDRIGHPAGLLEPRAPVFVTGSALMTRRALFAETGGFDERYFMFVEDVDYCWRVLLAGYDVAVVPDALVRHVGGASAPGGYRTAAGVSTTTFRIALRERNTLATLLTCYGALNIVLVLPIYLGQSIVTSVALALTGSPATAREVLRGLAWNLRQLPQTLRRRREVQRNRRRPDREITRRMAPGLVKLRAVRLSGLPQIDQASTPGGG